MKKSLSIILVSILFLTFIFSNCFFAYAKEDVSKQYEYSISNGEVRIFQFHLSGDVKIPAKINGYPVTAIDTDTTQPQGITSITIPEGVKEIAFFSFEGCENLSEISLPDSLEIIGTDAFKGTAYYNDKSNWKNGLLYIGKHLIAAKGSLSGEYEIKKGTITIADNAFSNCTNLTSLSIPKSVKNIGEHLFTNCAQLENISVAKENKYLSAKNGIIYNKNKTEILIASGGITGTVSLPKTVKSIRDGAFQNCDSITKVTLPDGIEKIGNRAFYSCDSLEKINLPDSIKEVGDSIIYATKYYQTQDNWDGYLLYVGKHLVDSDHENTKGTCTVKDGTLTIADDAFAYRDKLKKIKIPNSVIYLGKRAFLGCHRLTSIKLSKNITAIGSATFFECSNLESIDLPDGLKQIGSSAFYECRALKEINIPKSVTYIGSSAFAECQKIESFILPKGITKIANGTFDGCQAIKKIIIPKNVTEIGKNAFNNCYSLKEITLPNSLKKVGEYAFETCTKLTTIRYKGTKAEHKKISIADNNYNLTTVPWKYEPEKESTSKKETVSKKPVIQASSQEVQSNESLISSEETVSSPQSSDKTATTPKTEQKSGWIIWLFIGAIVVGIAGGFTAYLLLNKKSKTE